MVFTGDFPPSLLLLSYFKQLTDRVMDETAQADGAMTLNQLELVAVLGRKMTMKEVADALRMHPSNVTGLVNACTQAGWVERLPSKSDKRTKYLVLTKSGADQRNQILREVGRRLYDTAGISDEVATQILNHLKVT